MRKLECILPWTNLYLIGGTQGIKTCCWQSLRIDEGSTASADAAWNGNAAQRLRQAILSGRIAEICPRSCPVLRSHSATTAHLDELLRYVEATTTDEAAKANLNLIMDDIEAGRTSLRGTPFFLEIYGPHECNLECVMCWERLYEREGIGFNVMSLHGFRRFYGRSKVINYMGGEPLLSSREAILNTLETQPGKSLCLISNGVLLDQFPFDRWLQRFYWISVSLNAAHKHTHEAINKGSDWDLVLSNLRSLLNLRARKCLRYPRISISFVLTPANSAELPEFLELSRELGCGVSVQVARIEGHRAGDMAFRDLDNQQARNVLQSIDATLASNPSYRAALAAPRVALMSMLASNSL